MLGSEQNLIKAKQIKENPITDHVVAVSCGIVGGAMALDLDYLEDSNAEVDSNFIMSSEGIIEIQTCGEKRPFSEKEFLILLEYAKKGKAEIIEKQKTALGL
ncbi:MAG: hypothetical protein EOM40_05255 [Clostridia bacterium]|nr:hypothetical protein [Clostridia bacterium]